MVLHNFIKKSLFITVAVIFCAVLPVRLLFAQTTPASFISAPLWFSGELIEGEKVTISTALYNDGPTPLSGTVSFYDRDTLLGKTAVTVAPKGSVVAHTTWTVTAGDHRIRAELSNGKSGSGTSAVSLSSIATEEIKKNVVKTITVAPPRTDREGTPEGKQLEIVDALQAKIVDVLPGVVVEAAASVDALREEGAVQAEAWRTEALQKIEENKKAESAPVKSTSSGKNVDKNSDTTFSATPFSPFTYVQLFAGTIFAFILGNQLVAYGVLILIFVFIIRMIIRRFTDD